jgi:hypothetical protein
MTTTYNRLAARKIVGAIIHLLTGKHQPIPAPILRRIIAAHLRELYEILPRKFGGVVSKLECENDAGNAAALEFAAGLDLILSLVPSTYGGLPAGSRFTIDGGEDAVLTKRKGGVELITGRVVPHLAADVRITPL